MHRHAHSMKRLQLTFRVKEPFSAFSHLAGALLAVAALALLVTVAAVDATPWHVAAFSVYGACMILVYTASTLYHWLPLRPSGEKLFRKIDLSMIYLMIGGTYTPIALVALRGAVGWTMLALIWGLAVLGVALQWYPRSRKRAGFRRRLNAGVYLAMGWISIAFIAPIAEVLTSGGLFWLVAGGVAYTIGAVVYGVKRPNPIPRVVGFHEVFHIFVMLGSVCHFWLMYGHVLPLPAT